jgi:hypothetical protein
MALCLSKIVKGTCRRRRGRSPARINSDESLRLERPGQTARSGRNAGPARENRAVCRKPGLSEFPGATSPLHWFENYRAANSRAWLVTDDTDGKVPPPIEEANARNAARARARSAHGPADGPEDRSMYDRCITRGIPGSMMPAIYGNSYQILQGPGYVAIKYEMVNETRVIPLGPAPHLSGKIREYPATLAVTSKVTPVVETTNFHGQGTERQPDSLNTSGRSVRTRSSGR